MNDIWFDVAMISFDGDVWPVEGLCNKIWSEGNEICFENQFGKILRYDKSEYLEFKATWG